MIQVWLSCWLGIHMKVLLVRRFEKGCSHGTGGAVWRLEAQGLLYLFDGDCRPYFADGRT
jgi:hypothetical protein